MKRQIGRLKGRGRKHSSVSGYGFRLVNRYTRIQATLSSLSVSSSRNGTLFSAMQATIQVPQPTHLSRSMTIPNFLCFIRIPRNWPFTIGYLSLLQPLVITNWYNRINGCLKWAKLPKMPKIKETLRSISFYKTDSPAGSGNSSFQIVDHFLKNLQRFEIRLKYFALIMCQSRTS